MSNIVLGVDLDALKPQFDFSGSGRTLILDGDGPCYRAATTRATIESAMDVFHNIVLAQMMLTESEFCRIHLTGQGSNKNGRFNVPSVKPYQANRRSEKPALLELVRETVAKPDTWLPEYEVFMHMELEADDGIMIDAYEYQENGVVWSEDKDLRMTPFPYYEIDTNIVYMPLRHGWVKEITTHSGKKKAIGHGPMWFWYQMLAGDSADNIQGIKLLEGKKCGHVGAYNAIKDFATVPEAANFVINQYRAVEQDVIAEGHLLWLLRNPEDNVAKYFLGEECDLTKVNRNYIRKLIGENGYFKMA